MRACFFGTYNRTHPANRLLIRDLRAAGITVEECHQPLWEKTRDKTAGFFGAPSLAANAIRYMRCASILAARLKRAGRFELFIAGFNGQLDVLLLRLLRRGGAPILFAPLMSVSETLVDDRRLFTAGSVRGRVARLFDRLSLGAADVIVTDTEAHRAYLRERLAVQRPMIVHYLGADEDFFLPQSSSPAGEGPVTVLFYGQYVPLHGTEIIVEAAARISRQRDVRFCLIGSGPERASAQSRAKRLGARVDFVDWVELSELPKRVSSASICLGIFGSSGKSSMVIPTKVYQAAAAGRPIITSDTAAVREIFSHGENIYLCAAAEVEALASALRELLDHSSLAQQIGEGAKELMACRFDPARQAKRLLRELAAAVPDLARHLGLTGASMAEP